MDYYRRLLERMDSVHRVSREDQEKAGGRQKAAYDQRCLGRMLDPGDRVWIYDPTRKVGLSPKLATHWRGPGEVLERLTDVVYRVRFPGRTGPVVLHRNRMFEYHPKLAHQGVDAEPAIQPPLPPSPPRRGRGRPRKQPGPSSSPSFGVPTATRRRAAQQAAAGGVTSLTDTSAVPVPALDGPRAGSVPVLNTSSIPVPDGPGAGRVPDRSASAIPVPASDGPGAGSAPVPDTSSVPAPASDGPGAGRVPDPTPGHLRPGGTRVRRPPDRYCSRLLDPVEYESLTGVAGTLDSQGGAM